MTAAIIVAAGKGTRMGPNVDKLFLEISGRPLIAHTWAALDAMPILNELILVVRPGMEEAFHKVARQYLFRKPYQLAAGGAERQDSVWNGLQCVSPKTEIVAIHDGARPCATEDLFQDTITAARQHGAAVAAQRVTDTIKECDGGQLISRTVDRSRLWSVQTPQTFRVEVIRAALAAVRERGLAVTDDTAACELIGQPVLLVQSRQLNPKATSPLDLPLLELLLRPGGAQLPSGRAAAV